MNGKGIIFIRESKPLNEKIVVEFIFIDGNWRVKNTKHSKVYKRDRGSDGSQEIQIICS